MLSVVFLQTFLFFTMSNMRGFTLIEVIIYIALFSIIITGAFSTAYGLLDGSDKAMRKTEILEEGNFVLRKLSFALTGLDSTNPPTILGTGCSQSLTTNKTSFDSNPIIIRLNTIANVKYIEIKEGSGTFLPITTGTASTTCLKFQHIPAILGGPDGITGTATIGGIDFTITKYVRK